MGTAMTAQATALAIRPRLKEMRRSSNAMTVATQNIKIII